MGAFWTAAAAAAAFLAAVAAIVTAWATWLQVRGLKSALQADTMLKLLDRFDSIPFRETRKKAATACISQNKDPSGAAIDDVLDFFDDASFLVEKGP